MALQQLPPATASEFLRWFQSRGMATDYVAQWNTIRHITTAAIRTQGVLGVASELPPLSPARNAEPLSSPPPPGAPDRGRNSVHLLGTGTYALKRLSF